MWAHCSQLSSSNHSVQGGSSWWRPRISLPGPAPRQQTCNLQRTVSASSTCDLLCTCKHLQSQEKNDEYAAPLNQESSTLYVTISQHNLVQFVCSLFLLDTQPPSGLSLSFDSTAAWVYFLFWNRLCWLESAQFISSLLLHKKLALIGSKIIFTRSQTNLWGKVHSCDRDTRARNVPLGCADIHWGGRLHDMPKECLYRRLQCRFTLASNKILWLKHWPLLFVGFLHKFCQRFKSTWCNSCMNQGGMSCCVGAKISPAWLSIIEMNLVCCLTRK